MMRSITGILVSKGENLEKDRKGQGLVQVLGVNSATAENSGSRVTISRKGFVRLDPAVFKECIMLGLCFKCMGEGKKVKGVTKEHPNHLKPKGKEVPKENPPKPPPKKSFGNKKANVAAVDTEDVVDSDSDAETVQGKDTDVQTKN